MTPDPIILANERRREFAKQQIDRAPDGASVTISEAREQRTKAQNRLIHRWFAEIERATVGDSFAEIKAECNLTYGVPILTRDDAEWNSVFGYLFASLNRPAKIKAIRVLGIPVTSQMGVKQLIEYMDQMRRDYAELDIHLTDPDARKYGEAA